MNNACCGFSLADPERDLRPCANRVRNELPNFCESCTMTNARAFLLEAKASGYDFFTGVPCSFLTPLINATIDDQNSDYIAAASEGEAVAIASGAWLAGRKTTVMFQNSGLGNAINPLTSLNFPFRIPTMIVCTWRAGPGLKDEPQHELMGEITPQLFDTMRIPHLPFPKVDSTIKTTIGRASELIDAANLPVALILEQGDVESFDLKSSSRALRPRTGNLKSFSKGKIHVTRYAVLEELVGNVSDDTAIIATTGKCGRELFTVSDRPQHLYQVGSMGCAAGMGLGVALNSPNPVIVIDGDGALMMKMGTLATVGAYAPANMIHIVLDNGTYDSTGGQPSVSPYVDFAAAAVASGYTNGYQCDDLSGFLEALTDAKSVAGPTLIHMNIAPGSISNLGRPTISPANVARRFQRFLANKPDAGVPS